MTMEHIFKYIKRGDHFEKFNWKEEATFSNNDGGDYVYSSTDRLQTASRSVG